MTKPRTTRQETEEPQNGVAHVTIQIPVALGRDTGYQSRILQQDQTHLRSLTIDQRHAMQWLYAGMRKINAETEDGKPVATQQDAIRALLQSIYDAGVDSGLRNP